MSALGTISIKTKDGVYKNYTLSINDDTNEYGQNLKIYEEQTKEQRENGEKKRYVANGKIYYASDDLQSFVQKSEAKPEKATPVAADDLPF